MAYTIEHTQTLTTMHCGSDDCGIAFAIPDSLYRKANDDHSVWFYCPNGHHIHFLGIFDYAHLPPDLRDISAQLHVVAQNMVNHLQDGPELTAGLRKLREAKDCFVLAGRDGSGRPVSVVIENGAPVFVGSVLGGDEGSAIAHHYESDAIEFCKRHGQDADDVTSCEVLPDWQLRFTVYLADDEGRRYLRCDCGGRFFAHGKAPSHDGPCKPATVEHDVPLQGELPVWWRVA